ncbi:UNVERIFIED_CONTAM: hypothetical protein Slati_1536500 [Sesamum latifolium]|uniref:Uncharacterized protein n=1 Tax=Sesamum latifolium TaxID=2727402 RepID=A0AAW2XCB4_9LAMI
MIFYQKTRANVSRDSRFDEFKIDMLFDNRLHIFIIFHVHLDGLVSNILVLAFFLDFQSCFDLIPIPPYQRVLTEIPLDESLDVLKRELAFFANLAILSPAMLL